MTRTERSALSTAAKLNRQGDTRAAAIEALKCSDTKQLGIWLAQRPGVMREVDGGTLLTGYRLK